MLCAWPVASLKSIRIRAHVRYWNWEQPSGYMGVSSLQSNWTSQDQAPAAEWMSLAEYLELCRSADLRPMIGVNVSPNNQARPSL